MENGTTKVQAKPEQKKPSEMTGKEIVREIEKKFPIKYKLTFGQKASDKLTSFVGSWSFLILLFVFMFIWMLLNIYSWLNAWDPYPFILLNFVLSCLAAVQAPIILMSQNRDAEKDRIRLARDYMIDKRAEREIADMQQDLEEIKKLIKAIHTNTKKKKK